MAAAKRSSLAGVTILQLLESKFFSKFSEEQKIAISKRDIFHMVKDGEYLLRKGDSRKCLIVLMKGEVNAVNDKGKVVNRQIAGSVIGEISFLTKYPRTCSVVANGDVFVMELDEETIEQFDDSLILLIKDILIKVLVERLTEMDKIKARKKNKKISNAKKKERKKLKAKINKKRRKNDWIL
ncbi:MAG: cyclic nucleotide-binding domain-containing protein [Magnetococcales bacterium]|nr:cyclic nucleotide-binding domain-containing protein [Magnetococcales bacterium]